jgi:CBS domain-containing protein
MRVADIMTTSVVSVDPELPIKAVAKLLAERRISAVPVVDAELRVIGIISEGDLLRRAEIGAARRGSWWLELFTSNRELADAYVKSHAKTVRDVMTKEVVTASENVSLADIAELLEAHRIKRVPVIRNGILVGIVSRANLVQALASAAQPQWPARPDDSMIRDRLTAELKRQRWADLSPGNIVVQNGVVHLWGYVLSESERRALQVAAENVPGVTSVQDHTSKPPILAPI